MILATSATCNVDISHIIKNDIVLLYKKCYYNSNIWLLVEIELMVQEKRATVCNGQSSVAYRHRPTVINTAVCN